jgi:putative oxidoreductase
MTMSNELPAASGKGRLIILWTLSVLTALAFIAAGGSKLAGAPAMVEIFDKVGVGQWFRYFTGLVELTAGIGLLISRYAFYAALALAVVMIGATIAQLTVLAGSPAAPVALLVLNGVIAYLRKPVQLPIAGGDRVRT